MPASTMETYMMALRGEYCMAIFSAPLSMASSAVLELLPGGVFVLCRREGVELA